MNDKALPASVEFDGHPLSIIDHNGVPWITLGQIVKALGYQKPDAISQIYRRN